jgi:hypothetical protein
MRHCATYTRIAMVYGCARKCYHMKNKTMRVENYDVVTHEYVTKELPVLMLQKVSVVCVATVLAPYLLPVLLACDCMAIEMALRGISPKDYGYHVLDYSAPSQCILLDCIS